MGGVGDPGAIGISGHMNANAANDNRNTHAMPTNGAMPIAPGSEDLTQELILQAVRSPPHPIPLLPVVITPHPLEG